MPHLSIIIVPVATRQRRQLAGTNNRWNVNACRQFCSWAFANIRKSAIRSEKRTLFSQLSTAIRSASGELNSLIQYHEN